MHHEAHPEAGFSLTELLVVIGLVLVVVVAALNVLDSGMRAERGQRARADTLEDTRTGMNRLTKELRQALSVSTTSTRSRIEMQTLVSGVEHTVVYDVADGKLRRALDGGTASPLVAGVVSTSIFCYDPPICAATGPDTAAPSLVRVSIVAQPPVSNARVIELSNDVNLRNTGA